MSKVRRSISLDSDLDEQIIELMESSRDTRSHIINQAIAGIFLIRDRKIEELKELELFWSPMSIEVEAE